MSTACAVVALPIGRGGWGSERGDDRSDEELLGLVARSDDDGARRALRPLRPLRLRARAAGAP